MKRITALLISLMVMGPLVLAAGERGDKVLEQARLYREEGYRLQNSGQINEAYALYSKAVAIDPTFTEVYNDLGVVLEMKGDLNAAEQAYLQAVEQNPEYLPVYANLGFLYEKKMDREKAGYYWLQRFQKGEPGDYWHEVACQHLIELGTYDEAMRWVRERQAADLSQKLVYQREQQRLKDVEEARMHLKIGAEAYARGAYDQAVQEFETALSVAPADADMVASTQKLLNDARTAGFHQNVKALLDKSQGYWVEKDYLSLMAELRKALELVSEIPVEQLTGSM